MEDSSDLCVYNITLPLHIRGNGNLVLFVHDFSFFVFFIDDENDGNDVDFSDIVSVYVSECIVFILSLFQILS